MDIISVATEQRHLRGVSAAELSCAQQLLRYFLFFRQDKRSPEDFYDAIEHTVEHAAWRRHTRSCVRLRVTEHGLACACSCESCFPSSSNGDMRGRRRRHFGVPSKMDPSSTHWPRGRPNRVRFQGSDGPNQQTSSLMKNSAELLPKT